MKNTLRAVATGAAVYMAWKALAPAAKKAVSVSRSPSEEDGFWAGDALKHFAINILMVALIKTFKERSSGTSPLRSLLPSKN